MESILSTIYVEARFQFPLILSVTASYTQRTAFAFIYLGSCDSAVGTVTVRGSNPLTDNIQLSGLTQPATCSQGTAVLHRG